jgi:hypothetical protein
MSETERPIQVVIADDHPVTRAGIRTTESPNATTPSALPIATQHTLRFQ